VTSAARIRDAVPGPWARIRQVLIRRGPLLVFALLLAYLAWQSPVFLGSWNIQASLTQAAPIAIVAFGLVAVVMGGGDDVVAGGIDLSVPAGAALATAILSDQLTNAGASFGWAMLLATGAALAIGVVNAILVTRIGLTSLLATLATFTSVVGITRVLTSNRRINVDDPVVLMVRDGQVLGIPNAVWLMLVAGAAFTFLMHQTAFGMRVQAVGGNREAAITSGIRPRPHIAMTFIIAGAAAAVASLALVARGSGSSPGVEDLLVVDMLLAGYLGAAFSPRNVVTIPGAMLGAIFVALLSNGLILIQVDNSWILGLKGVLILIVVSAAALQSRQR
jgi:ribose transport system permease protein